MSAALQTIGEVLAGQPKAAQALLGPCRTWAYGAEAFGGVMACELFARQPAPLSPDTHVVTAETAMAVFDVDAQGREQAVFADLYGGAIGRLWRLGDGVVDAAAEPALFMASDSVMTQVRTDLAFAASDHPNLNAAAIPALLDLTGRVAHADRDGGAPVVEARAFVIRAFSERERAAALFFVEQAAGADVRQRPRFLVGAAFRFSAAGLVHHRIVQDRVAPPPPRFRL